MVSDDDWHLTCVTTVRHLSEPWFWGLKITKNHLCTTWQKWTSVYLRWSEHEKWWFVTNGQNFIIPTSERSPDRCHHHVSQSTADIDYDSSQNHVKIRCQNDGIFQNTILSIARYALAWMKIFQFLSELDFEVSKWCQNDLSESLLDMVCKHVSCTGSGIMIWDYPRTWYLLRALSGDHLWETSDHDLPVSLVTLACIVKYSKLWCKIMSVIMYGIVCNIVSRSYTSHNHTCHDYDTSISCHLTPVLSVF